MASLVLTLATVLLLGGFVALTRYEARRGLRVLPVWRAQFDQDIAHAAGIISHIDFGALVQDESKRLLNRAGHAIAHLSLQIVRAIERFLTRLVRHFRAHSAAPAAMPPRENAREFVQTLSDFKGNLKTTQSGVSQTD